LWESLAIYERYWEILMLQLLVRIVTIVCGAGIISSSDFFFSENNTWKYKLQYTASLA